jgi:4-methyl-5(b-hydroxyethyl)-thiazole monophosphate biosynthesis
MTKVAIILADGLEEVEAITPIDFLRRAGIQVVTVGLDKSVIQGSHGVSLMADVELDQFPEDADAVIIPGGMPGSAHIAANDHIVNLIRGFHKEGKLVAALCAAPALVLGEAGILEKSRYTCYPGFQDKAGPLGDYSTDRVVCDKNIITACGVGAAAEFSAEVIAYLSSRKKADEVMKSTLQAGY